MGALKFQVVDDFYPDPWEVRNFALSLPYEDATTSQDKTYYKGLLSPPSHPYSAFGLELIGTSLGRMLSWSGPVGEFRLLLAREESDDFGRTWVHSDTSAARYSALVYHNPPDQCQGGTSFYRHRELGWDHMPARQSHAVAHVIADAHISFADLLAKITDDGFDIERKWELVTRIPMRFNRCVVFDSRLFHARTGSFGKTFRDGRLTQNFFFDIVGDRRALE